MWLKTNRRIRDAAEAVTCRLMRGGSLTQPTPARTSTIELKGFSKPHGASMERATFAIRSVLTDASQSHRNALCAADGRWRLVVGGRPAASGPHGQDMSESSSAPFRLCCNSGLRSTDVEGRHRNHVQHGPFRRRRRGHLGQFHPQFQLIN